MELILVRHGLPVTTENRDGSPADPPLSERGRAQAAALAHWLAEEPLDVIYSSPLRRAWQTALPLAEQRGLEIALEPRVAEYDRDSESYVPLEELRERDYPAWRAFMEQGYPPGPMLDAFLGDVVEALEQIIAQNPGRRVAVVCHGGVINAWAAHVVGVEFKLFFDPHYTSLNRFLAASSGVRSVQSLNETAHLRGL